MKSLIIKQKDATQTVIQQLVINKDHVSAVYSESDAVVTEFAQDIGGTLILLMNSGKEFRFKYDHHFKASVSWALLMSAIHLDSIPEIEI
jgi:hypothetical protein